MDDLISRRKAIDRINKQREHLQPDIYPQDKIGDTAYRICAEFIARLPSAQPERKKSDWIPVERELPNDLEEVNVTWVNHEPEPYYESIKSKPFTASAVYYEGNWYWYSSVCADVLAEYGRNDVDKVDDTIEITAWRPLPEPYKGGGSE